MCKRQSNHIYPKLWPEATEGRMKVTLSHEELALLLGGIDLAQTRKRNWYRAVTDLEQIPA